MPIEYKSIRTKMSNEIIEKKSRFIADAGIVTCEDEARMFLDEVKTHYREASHHTYAYVIGKKAPSARYSDDGEPHGTAGLPLLDVLNANGLTNTIIVVTRYFGGTKLGTGGLVRAYTKSASACLAIAGITRYIPGEIIRITIDYHYLGKIKNHLEKCGYEVLNEEYASHVIINTLIPDTESDSLKTKITDLTNAAAKIEKAGERYIEAEE